MSHRSRICFIPILGNVENLKKRKSLFLLNIFYVEFRCALGFDKKNLILNYVKYLMFLVFEWNSVSAVTIKIRILNTSHTLCILTYSRPNVPLPL